MFIIGVEVQGKENRTLRCVTEMGSRRLANRKKKKNLSHCLSVVETNRNLPSSKNWMSDVSRL